MNGKVSLRPTAPLPFWPQIQALSGIGYYPLPRRYLLTPEGLLSICFCYRRCRGSLNANERAPAALSQGLRGGSLGHRAAQP